MMLTRRKNVDSTPALRDSFAAFDVPNLAYQLPRTTEDEKQNHNVRNKIPDVRVTASPAEGHDVPVESHAIIGSHTGTFVVFSSSA